MIKILHLADLHLDSPMKRLPYSQSRHFREKMRRTFASAVKTAVDQHCAAILLSGDLFDTEFYSRETVNFLTEQFREAPDCRFIIAPGNHDPFNARSPYAMAEFPENVYIFHSEELSCFVFPDICLTVYGYAFTSQAYARRPLAGFSVNGAGYHVLCAHADTENAVSTYAPISASELENSGLDYAALGHIHTKPEMLRFGNTLAAYSGCLAARDFSECGDKGGILVTLDSANGEKNVTAERLRFCPWKYEIFSPDITGIPEAELSEFLSSTMKKFVSGDPETEFFIRAELKGCIPYRPDTEALSDALAPLGVVSVCDRTVLLPSSGLANDYSVRGELYRILKPKLESADPQERETASMALRLGLSALEN